MKIGSRIPGHIRRLRPCAIGGHTLFAGQGCSLDPPSKHVILWVIEEWLGEGTNPPPPPPPPSSSFGDRGDLPGWQKDDGKRWEFRSYHSKKRPRTRRIGTWRYTDTAF